MMMVCNVSMQNHGFVKCEFGFLEQYVLVYGKWELTTIDPTISQRFVFFTDKPGKGLGKNLCNFLL